MMTKRMNKLMVFVLGLLLTCLMTDRVFADSTKTSTKAAWPHQSLEALAMSKTDRVVIDGRLDETVWSRAIAGSGFVERNPTPDAKPPVSNWVRVLYDDTAVYVGVQMQNLEGETPLGRAMARDTSRIWSDDAVTIKFDVHRDRRTTLGFAINVATAQIDFIALENGRTFKTEFDAVWEGKASSDSDCWYAEFKIPHTALGLPWSETKRTMGLNVSRDHASRNATYDWARMPTGYGPASALHYGDLTGFEKVGGGVPMNFVPYVLLQHPTQIKAGGDLKVRVGQDSWVELTAFTDFAQIDLDDPVVNLSRFPLRLPEKRPFFLSGLEIFNFNSPMLFFSRRIGLNDDDEEIPLWSGVKVHSRVGNVGLGFLDVLTEEDHSALARTRVNFGDYGFLGVMGTLQHKLEDPETIRHAVGIDGGLRLFDYRLSLSSDLSWAPPIDSSDISAALAGAIDLKWLEEPFKPRLVLKYVGEEFDPVVGFVRRSGFTSANPILLWVSRPKFWGLETLDFRLAGLARLADDFDTDLGQETSARINAKFRNGWSSNFRIRYSRDVVEDAFDLLDEIPIASGVYAGTQALLEISNNPRSDLRAGFEYSFGDDYFGGQLQSAVLSSGYAVSQMLKVSANAGVSLVDLPGVESFQTLTLKSVLEFTPSPSIVSYATLLMVDNDLNADLDQGVFLFRLRWRYMPGSDMFLVYREDIDLNSNEANERSVAFKLNYRFDTVF